jgi:hypothetical protein
MCMKVVGFIVHVGMKSTHTRRTKFACDTIMVVRAVVTICSKWIICTTMVCAQHACVHNCVVLLLLL